MLGPNDDLGGRAALLTELLQGKFEFLDFGCSRGGSIAMAMKLFGAKRGLGLDIDQAKIDQAVAAGCNAMLYDIHKLPSRPLVRFCVMAHFLEHIPDRNDVGAFLRKASATSREFVFIRQPYFDSDGYLLRKNLKLFWSDWHGHPNTMSTLEFHSILAPLKASGQIGNFSIHVAGPITSSAHEAVHPLSSPCDQFEYDAERHQPKAMDIQFDDPAYRETMVFISKPGVDHYGPFSKIKFDKTFFDSAAPS